MGLTTGTSRNGTTCSVLWDSINDATPLFPDNNDNSYGLLFDLFTRLILAPRNKSTRAQAS